MTIQSLFDPDSAEHYLRALVALSFAGATAASGLRSHVRIDRETLRRAIGRFMVGMRVYR